MKISLGPDGTISIEAEAQDLSSLIEFISCGLIKRKETKFIRTLELMGSSRNLLSKLASQTSNCRLLHEDIPLFLNPHFDGKLHDIFAINCTFDDRHEECSLQLKNLPNNQDSYLNNIIQHKFLGNATNAPYKNSYCYRLTNIKSATELEFEYCYYFHYINTCEYFFYLFSYEINNQLQRKNNSFQLKKPIRRNIELDNYRSRYMVPGINTLLVFWDESDPIMYIHERNKKTTAEAINVKHVVPAGTFQPIHMDNGNHEIDFSLYTNIMREFGEELAGDSDLTLPKGVLQSVLERPSLKSLDHLIREVKRGKIYFAGLTYDCLTLKPEILTIMILYKKDFESFIGPINFEVNVEGDPYAVRFSRDNLYKYALKTDMLPAGAGCLYMAYKHFDYIIDNL